MVRCFVTWAIPCYFGEVGEYGWKEDLLEETILLVRAGSAGSLGILLGPRALPLWSVPDARRISPRSSPSGRSSSCPCQEPHLPAPSRAVLGADHSGVPKLRLGVSARTPLERSLTQRGRLAMGFQSLPEPLQWGRHQFRIYTITYFD